MADRSAEARAHITRRYARLEGQDHFQVLGLTPDSQPHEIKARYVELVKKWHVDNFATLDLGEVHAQLEAIFKRIAEAHEVLTTPDKRAEYLVERKRSQEGLSNDVHAVLKGEAKFDEGLTDLRHKKYREALAAFEESIRLNPDDPLIWTHRAWARFRVEKGQPHAAKVARDELQRALEAQENLPIAHQYLGQIAFERDEPEMALRHLKACLEWDERNIEATRLSRLIRSRLSKKATSSGPAAWLAKLFGK